MCGSYKLACNFLSLSVLLIILLFFWITWVNVLAMHWVHSVSGIVLSSISTFIWHVKPESVTSSNIDCCIRVSVHSLFGALLSFIPTFIWYMELGSVTSSNIDCYVGVDPIWELFLESSKYSEFTNTFIGLYSLVKPRSMPSTSLKAYTTYALLMWGNCWSQRQTSLFL